MARNFCSSCGTRIAEGAAHCVGCGARIDGAPPPAAGQPAPPPPAAAYAAAPHGAAPAPGAPLAPPPHQQPHHPHPYGHPQGAQPSALSNFPADAFNVANALTTKLGLEKVENFSIKTFFGDVFKRRTPDEIEDHCSVGYRTTTPPLSPRMAEMPAPWLFGRTLLAAMIVFIPLWITYSNTQNTKLVPGLILIGAFAVPVSVLVLLYELNTPRNVSIAKVAYLFMTGAAASLVISLILFGSTGLAEALGAPAAGLIEETGKLAALIIITRNMPNERYPYALNGLLFGGAVGAGFAAFETAGYALEAGLNGGATQMMEIMKLRGLLAPFAHVAWTAMVGYAYWRLRATGMSLGDILAHPSFLKILAAAMVIHALWNTDYVGPFYVKFVLLGIVAWIIIISMTQSGLKEVGRRAAIPADFALPGGPAAAAVAAAPVLPQPGQAPGQS